MASNIRKRTRDVTDAVATPDTGTENPVPAKRVKRVEENKAVTRVRRKGTLQELPKMPLDIIDEVLKRMRIEDLLNLSRTTKAFRELVLAPGARRFWKEAMKNSQAEGLPECPKWLSEPAYANLMYSPYCHVRKTIDIRSWHCGLQYFYRIVSLETYNRSCSP
ncbi:hypothetical protein QCA50_002548 [Cerrena zonata]|uniref:F-box domain-containing protein n=1 Tax=Cerrena zonata TaxID=2478898 RepID=A0AAW0GZB9_9APHY